MTTHSHFANGLVICLASTAAAAAYLSGWPLPGRHVEFGALVLAVLLTTRLATERTAVSEAVLVRPSFLVTFTTLLLFGPGPATVVALAGVLSSAFGADRSRREVLRDVLRTAFAIQAAGLAYRALEGAAAGWPWRALPVAAAAAAFIAALAIQRHVMGPLAGRRAIDRSWLRPTLAAAPLYFLASGMAAALAELIVHRLWTMLPVAAAALYCAHHAFADYTRRLEDERRRREVMDALEQGMAVLDRGGLVTLWNEALERMLGIAQADALGRTLVELLPPLNRTDLPRSLKDVQAGQAERGTATVRLAAAADSRVYRVNILPVSGGVTLLWSDVTERLRAEQEIRQTGERLALAAEGANDGLWQWDLRSQEFYVSGRWRAMTGLPAAAGTGAPGEWLDRVHPDDVADLKSTLEAHLAGHTEVFQHEHRLRHEDGSYRRVLCRGLAVRGRGRRADRIAGSLTDTTEQAIAQERLRSVGFLDPLTGLYNRAVFVEGLGHRINDCKRRPGQGFAVLYLDLDRFKIVNDSLGHLVGDELLIAVSRRLESCLRPGDALARLGGDEFAVLLSGLADDGQANAIAFRIQDALSAPFSIGGREVFTSASIGIAFGPAHYANPDELMRDADTAMYHAKARGKARHEVFDADMHARVRDRLSLENDLRRAVTALDFEVHYQPIVSLTTGMCIGFESLVRWTRNGEKISPATFIPIAEELGLIEPVGTWVLEQACHAFADWQRRFPAAGLDCITVNVSSRQLVQQNFPRVVQQAVRASGLRPADLRVEITETALMDNPGEAAGILRELRDFGVKVYLDDFGTGYSSLSHLHKLPVDALKIDRSFVRSLLLPNRPAIVESILALARTLNTSVVAEGIEDDVQARELERLGCTHAQGFLFSPPICATDAEALIRARQPLGPKRVTPAADDAAAAPVPAGAVRLASRRRVPSPHEASSATG